MKRKLIALCGVVLAFALTACGTTTSSSVGKGGNNTSRSSVVAQAAASPQVPKLVLLKYTFTYLLPEQRPALSLLKHVHVVLKAYRFNIGDAAGWNDENSK